MVAITECPNRWIGQEARELMLYADLYSKGNPPVAGGAMDQTRLFIEACRLIWSEEGFWKRKLGIIG